jgi:hypothetical protein
VVDARGRTHASRMTILQFDPEQYPQQARLIAQRVEEHERCMRERKNAQQEAKRVFEGVDESDEEEEPPPDLMMVFIPVPAFTGPI